MKKHTRLRLY